MREHVILRDAAPISTVVVGRDVVDVLVSAVAEHEPSRVAVLCQPSTVRLADAYAGALESAGIAASGLTLPDGESAKRLMVVEDVYRFLNAEQFTRSDVVVGVGGGALTDVVGFAAATYLRGIAAIYAPTTLLAAVDAAIGGKTAVNVGGKNLAGVFAHPTHVVVDVDVLDALPPALKVEGAAEAVKTGFIADPELVGILRDEGLDADLEVVVNRAIAVKTRVVTEDFTERGERAILNYGHTIGHAIEATTGYSHGKAVAVGMVAAGFASEHAVGFAGAHEQIDVLQQIGLPIRAPDAHKDRVMAMMALDKKRDRSGIRMVLLESFGSPVLKTVDDATVRAAFAGIALD